MNNLLQWLFANETVLAGIAGATAGAVVSIGLQLVVHSMRRRSEVRRGLLGEIAEDCHDAIAAMYRLAVARREQVDCALNLESAEVARLRGRRLKLNAQIWNAFREVKVRAAWTRLLFRADTAVDYVRDNDLEKKDIEQAIQWLADGLSDVTLVIDRVTGMTLGASRLNWIGWGDRAVARLVAFSFEPEPPPWKTDTIFAYKRQWPESARMAVRNKVRDALGDLRCPEHHRCVHILFLGRSPRDADMQVITCCEALATKAEKMLERARLA